MTAGRRSAAFSVGMKPASRAMAAGGLGREVRHVPGVPGPVILQARIPICLDQGMEAVFGPVDEHEPSDRIIQIAASPSVRNQERGQRADPLESQEIAAVDADLVLGGGVVGAPRNGQYETGRGGHPA